LTEISADLLESELKFYEDTVCTAQIYDGTKEGELHKIEARVHKAALYRLGLLDDKENHKRVRSAELRAEKARRVR
jgi:hypothetical protein